MRRVNWALITTAALVAFSCNVVLGIDERAPLDAGDAGGAGSSTSAGANGPGSTGGVGGSGGSGGSISGGGGALSCASADIVCLDETPIDWSGPVMVDEATSESSLVDCVSFPEHATTQHDLVRAGIFASATTCDCTCGAISGLAGCETTIVTHGISNCSPGPTLNLGECGAFTASQFVRAPNGTANASGASCTPNADTSVPQLDWAVYARSCGPVPYSTCVEGPCIAEPNEAFARGVCIYRDGDHACPTGSFSERYVNFEGVEDTRGCTTCACDTFSLLNCGVVVRAYTGSDCTGSQTLLSASCSNVGLFRSSARYIANAPTGQCDPSAVTPTGSATPSEPVTFCCARGNPSNP